MTVFSVGSYLGFFKNMRSAALCVAIWLCAVGALSAYESKARAIYVYDVNTGTVLVSKNADEPLPPASMSKLMTVYMAFDALRSGRLSMRDRLPVSQHAMDYKGSTMYLDTRDRVSVEDLLRGIIVLSGNDASAVIAEALSPTGTEAGFAQQMTITARKLGMTQSTFANSNGWPDPKHRMSMHDLVILSQALIEEFPEYYPLFAETKFAFDGRAPSNVNNRNPLLYLDIGADGLKTGHTNASGYGLVGSVKRGDRRIIFAFTGLDSQKERAEEAEAITNWAFRSFETKRIAEPEVILGHADVWMGAVSKVGLHSPTALDVLWPAYAGQASARIEYQGPLYPPLSTDQAVAHLVVDVDGIEEAQRFELFPDQEVSTGGILTRMWATAQHVLRRATGASASP